MKITLITLFIAIVAVSAQAQSGTTAEIKQAKAIKFKSSGKTITPTIDSNVTAHHLIYTIPGDKNIDLLYGLLQAGYQAVQKSDDFSKTQVKQYMTGLIHLDSLLWPQIVKFHPDTTKKVRKP